MFKGKLIGVLEVKEARGDRMCQDALQELKMAIKASGEHKQRVNIQIAVDGLKIRDEKSGVSEKATIMLRNPVCQAVVKLNCATVEKVNQEINCQARSSFDDSKISFATVLDKESGLI